ILNFTTTKNAMLSSCALNQEEVCYFPRLTTTTTTMKHIVELVLLPVLIKRLKFTRYSLLHHLRIPPLNLNQLDHRLYQIVLQPVYQNQVSLLYPLLLKP